MNLSDYFTNVQDLLKKQKEKLDTQIKEKEIEDKKKQDSEGEDKN